MYSESDLKLIEKAKKFSEKAHKGQLRKSGNPFIEHPYRVAEILMSANAPATVVSAGYAHDVAEDTKYTLEDIEQELGTEVANLVKSNTENKAYSWLERKLHTIHQIHKLSVEERLLLLADKLANVEDLEKDLHLGEELWSRFNAPYYNQKWYYTSVALTSKLNLTEDELELIPNYFDVYSALVDKVFK